MGAARLGPNLSSRANRTTRSFQRTPRRQQRRHEPAMPRAEPGRSPAEGSRRPECAGLGGPERVLETGARQVGSQRAGGRKYQIRKYQFQTAIGKREQQAAGAGLRAARGVAPRGAHMGPHRGGRPTLRLTNRAGHVRQAHRVHIPREERRRR